MLKWERVKEENTSHGRVMSRAKVYGGWLLEHATLNKKDGFSFSITFIPDMEHKWELDDLS